MFDVFDSELQKFKIKCDNESGVYTPGQTISGKVVIILASEKKIQDVTIRSVGKATVEWTETEFDNESKEITKVKTDRCSEDEIYFDNTHSLIRNDKTDGAEIWLPPGRSEYTFSSALPKLIPSSFRGEFGSVKYYLQATIKMALTRDLEVQCPLEVHHILNLSTHPTAAASIQTTKQKTFGTLCCRSGPIGFHFMMPKIGFVPEEFVIFTAELFNMSNRKDHVSSMLLIEKVRFRAEGQFKTTTKELLRVQGPDLIPRSSEIWTGNHLQIPSSLPPTKLGGCRIIDLHYCLKMVLETPKGISVEEEIEIILGTIPV